MVFRFHGISKRSSWRKTVEGGCSEVPRGSIFSWILGLPSTVPGKNLANGWKLTFLPKQLYQMYQTVFFFGLNSSMRVFGNKDVSLSRS